MKKGEMLERTREYAIETHRDQLYGDPSYRVHLEHVELVLRRFGVSEENEAGRAFLIAAWLHDVVEDADRTIDNIHAEVGREVAELVHAVISEPGRNRKERAAKPYTPRSWQAVAPCY